MRIVVKGADFSAVSIGKVTKDLSFNYPTSDSLRTFPWLNGPASTTALPWVDGSFTSTTLYIASSGDNSYSTSESDHRLVSDFIEVSEGMKISTNLANTTNVPVIVCFNENKQPLGPGSTYALWISWHLSGILVIPSGVKYIKIQTSNLMEATPTCFCKGEMPVI